MSHSSKLQIPGGLPAGMLKFGIDQCIILFQRLFCGLSFFKTSYNVPCTFYKPMGLDLQKLTKSLHGLTELKMTLQSVMLFQKCNKVHIH